MGTTRRNSYDRTGNRFYAPGLQHEFCKDSVGFDQPVNRADDQLPVRSYRGAVYSELLFEEEEQGAVRIKLFIISY